MLASVSDKQTVQILIADDSETNQKLLTRVLNYFGYDVDAVGDGVQVLEALKHKAYHVVFLDINMPNMDGVETAQLIHEDEALSPRPLLIAASANSANNLGLEYTVNGVFDSFLPKPLDIDKIKSLMENIAAQCG